MTPTVSFVVPCYKLAHLLRECVESILSQTYGDFEVLIMDDCSPDNTPGVAQSFQDPRVKYIRNDQNLGHLRNYNKGISLTLGKYVWLISADDYLRRSYILQRYVELLEKNPRVGYTFCPGIGVKNGQETEILEYSAQGNRDRILDGRAFLKKLLEFNIVLAASGMARRECYEKISFFPLNMPWAGDWYLWCVFALHFDVGYFAEPMVCYRTHDLSMSSALMQGVHEKCAAEEIAIRRVIRQKAEEAGYRRVSRACLHTTANQYARSAKLRAYQASSSFTILEQFEASLCQYVADESERNYVRARVYAGIADGCYGRGELALAKRFYLAGLRKDPRMPKILAKWFLLSLGKFGDYLWSILRSIRHSKPVHSDGQSI